MTRRDFGLATAALAVSAALLPPSVAAAAPTAAVPQVAEPAWVAQTDLFTDVEEKVTRSGARRMQTSATYYPLERRVVASTRTQNAVKFSGFTGGVHVLFLNADERVIGATSMHTFGVNGTWVGGSANRVDYWEEPIDAPWLSQAAAIRAVHSHAGKNRVKELVRYAADSAQPLVDLLNELEDLKPEA